MILIAYDGSRDAQSAIDLAGDLMSGEPATVLSVWEPFIDVMARTGLGVGPGDIDFEQIDKANEESARERAAEGVKHAGRAGLNAQRRRFVGIGSLADGLVDEAKSVILLVRTKRTDHRRAKSKSGDSSGTRGKR